MKLKPIRLEGLALDALEALPQPIWAYDRETLRFVWANDVAVEWLGYSREVLFSKTIVELRPPEHQKAITDAARNFKEVAADAGTWPFITASGEFLNAAVHWHRATYNGRDAVLASVRDLTELARVQSERTALHEENTALRAASGIEIEHFRRLFESAPTKFLVVRPYTYEIVAVSDAYAAATLSRREELVGRTLFEAFPDDPDDTKADGVKNLQESLRRVETLKTADSMAVQRYPVRRPDGTFEERYWTCVNSPVRGPDGELAYIVHRAEDVTALYLEPRTSAEIERAPLLRDVLLQAQELRHSLTRTQEQEARLRIGERLLDFGAWEYDFATRQINWSDQIFKIHGMEPHQGSPDFDTYLTLIHPDDREEMIDRFSKFATGGSPDLELQHRVRRPDGSYRYIKAVGERHSKYGRDVIVGLGQDVTDIVETQRRSEELQQRLTSTLEHMGDAFYLLSPKYEFLYLNKQAEKLLRRSRDELLGRYIWEAFPESRSNFISVIPANIDPTKEMSFEFFYEPFDAWFAVDLYPVPEGIAVYFRDITRERVREMQLKLLEVAVERLNDVVMITDARPIDPPVGPRIVYVNEAFTRRTGYTREEVIGKTPRILQGPGTDRESLDQIRQALQQWQPVRAELLNYKKSGEEFWLELEIVPISNDKGEYTHWVSIERDVTERRALEERLRESQKLEAMGQLTGGVAHDFNNLLTVILGNAELLATRLSKDAQLRLMAEMTAKAAERGAELTNRLLAFARRQALQPKIVDVNKLIASIEPMLRRTISEEIELEFVRGAGLWPAEIDPGQLEVAMLNLIINARDAMPDGGKLTLETGNAHLDDDYAALHDELKPGQYVMISVSDTGSGMTPETLARAFEPFYTTKEVGKGSGLGLSMVFGFAKQSGGHVKIYSEPDHGTSVKLYFPRSRAARDADPETGSRETIMRGSEHILVVEDNDLVREHLSAQLESLGYLVTSAPNGPRALDIIRQTPNLDMLLTDIVMPGGMNGKQLADEALKLRPALKVLFSSGYSENAIVHHGRLDAGVELLSKPYRLRELATKVRKVMDGQS